MENNPDNYQKIEEGLQADFKAKDISIRLKKYSSDTDECIRFRGKNIILINRNNDGSWVVNFIKS